MRLRRGLTAGALLASALMLAPSHASAIIGGDVDPAPSAVVALSGTTSGGATGLVCTGTLVAPNVVLTARHCVEEGKPSCTDTFTGVAKYVSLSVTTDGGVYPVASTRVPAGTSPCHDDVALLVLSSAVPASDGSPVADVRLGRATKGEGYSAVGYGWTCPEGGDTCSSKGVRRRKDGLAVECIDCRQGTWAGTSDVTCVGDSGGPAFDANGRVFGVTSVGGLGCSTAYYTRLDAHDAFLRDTVTSEATKAGVAVPAWTVANEAAPDAGAPAAEDAGTGPTSGATATPSSSSDAGGCAVGSRPRSSSAMSAFVALGLVLVTRACRRSTRRAPTTTSSARATRSIAARTIPAAITRSSTTSRSISSPATAPARTSSSAAAAPASSSSA